MWPIDSSLDESMNEQVLTITTSAFSASGTTIMPAWWRWPTMISLSTRFLAQPREMRLTLIIGVGVGVALVTPRREQARALQFSDVARKQNGPKAKRPRIAGPHFRDD